MSKLIWLDDERDPFENEGKWLEFAPIIADEIIWIKNYGGFIGWITENGLPDGIAFDHDLSDVEEWVDDWFDVENNGEYTGMDCAKWLVDYCIDNDKPLPLFSSQSANPCGRDNILGLLNNYLKSQTNE